MKRKLLMVIPHASTGGQPQYALRKMQELINDYELYVIEYSFYGIDFQVQRNQMTDLLGNRFFSLGNDTNKEEILGLIDSISPDIIHFEEMPEMYMSDNIADKIYNNPNRKYFICETTHDSSWDVNTKRFLPDQFIFVSEFSKKQFQVLNIPSEVVLYPIEHKERPDRTTALLELGLDPNKKHVLYIALWTWRKNQGELVEYARELQHHPIEFHFVGALAGNFSGYWKDIVDNKPDNCIIHGQRDDVDKWYAACDLFVFTSCARPGDTETNPLVIREATSWNMPFLMYDLDVYMHMYDKYSNIKYLSKDNQIYPTNKLSVNANMILGELDLPHVAFIPYLLVEAKPEPLYKPIYIFSHNYLVNNWKEVLTEQLTKLVDSGLYLVARKITLGVYAENDNLFYEFIQTIKEFDDERKFEVVRFDENNDEFNTLEYLKNTVDELKESMFGDSHILYFHLKGVTSKQSHSDVNVNDGAVKSWRHVMEYFNIECWKDCVNAMNEVSDIVGCFWNDQDHEMYPNMFCGNFWWARASYIKNLPKIDTINDNRMNAEMWIGMGGVFTWRSFFGSKPNKNQLYEAIWEPYEYKKLETKIIHLLTDITTERESKSISNLMCLPNYTQNINNIYKELPPKETCRRPSDIGMEPGDMILTPAHYGCYNAHKDAILNNMDKDGIIILECDAILNIDIDEFMKYVERANVLCYEKDLEFFSFGYNFEQNGKEFIDDYCIINDISDISELHAYYIPKKSFETFKKLFEQPWDVTDILYTEYFKGKKMGYFNDVLVRQGGGYSLLDKKEKNIELDNMYDKDNIFIFSHNYLVNNWKEVVLNQLNLLIEYGLYDTANLISYNVYGDDVSFQMFEENVKLLDIKNKIRISRLEENNYEFDTLDRIFHFAKLYNGNGNILYFHTKGVVSEHDTNNADWAIKNWRNNLEQFTIKEWKYCLEKLQEGNDIVGPYYFDQNPELIPIFAGNFWWANIQYIKKLDITQRNGRGNCENWITSIPHKSYNLYTPKDLNLYNPYVPKIGKIAVFSHNYLVDNWYEIVEEQLYLLTSGGLYDSADHIEYHIIHNNKYAEIAGLIKKYDKYKKIVTVYTGFNHYENVTLNEIKKYTKQNPDSKICYFHTKGVTNKTLGMETWRQYVNYFTITNWNKNIEVLNNYDVSCVDSYYSKDITCANFWWANGKYINTLNEIENFTDRFFAEKWILSNPNRNVYSMHESNIPLPNYLYDTYYSPLEYRNDYDKWIDEIYWYANKYHAIQQKEMEWKPLLKYLLDSPVKKDNVLDIGCYDGGTTHGLSQIFKNIVTVDLVRQPTIDYFEKRHSNWKFFEGSSYSEEMINNIKSLGIKFNVIFIDGDHGYVGVKKDFELYQQFLEEDGIMFFHDIVDSQWHMEMGCKVPKLWNELKTQYDTFEIVSTDRNEIGDIDSYNNNLKWLCGYYELFGGIGILPKIGRLNKLMHRRRMLLDYTPEITTNNFDTLLGIKEIIDEYLSKESIVAEIGSYAGVTCELFALRCKEVYAVDPWEFYPEIQDMYFREAEPEFDSMHKRYNNIIKIKEKSVDGSKLFENNKFDAVYIDGCHEYECVREDIIHWLPKIKPSGIICGHDYNQPQIKKAVDELLGEGNIRTYQDSSWLVDLRNYKGTDKYDGIWKGSVEYGITQYESEYIETLKFLESNTSHKNVLEIGTRFGGTSRGFCEIFDNVYSIDISHHTNFDKLKSEFPNFNYIIADSKLESTINIIRELGIKFDFIFIDGDHSYDGVKSDYENYKEFLIEGGYIGFHDIIDSEYNNTSGDIQVQRLWKEIKNNFEHFEFYNKNYNYKNDHNDFFNNFFRERREVGDELMGIGLLKYTTNDIKDIHIFTHNYLIHDWRTIFEEQFDKLLNTGLYESASSIYYGVYVENDDENEYAYFCKRISELDRFHKVRINRYTENIRELQTLMEIRNFSINSPKDVNVLYFHMKGVFSGELTKHDKKYVTRWRHYLEYFNIEKYKDCLSKLQEGNDIVGCLYVNLWFEEYGESRMFAGNFWWAHTDYLKTLPELTKERVVAWWIYLETWIAQGNHTWYNFYTDVQKDTWDFYTFFPDESIWKNTITNDEVFIITSHPTYNAIQETTIKCIESCKATGRDVILATHCAIPDKIKDIAAYWVYDPNNISIQHDFYDTTWFSTENYRVDINLKKYGNNSNHAIGVSNNYHSGILKAKELGYKWAIASNFDLIFDSKDWHIFNDKIAELKSTNQKAYFMYMKSGEGPTLKTIFFIIDIDYYLENFKYFKDELEYKQEIQRVNSETNCLENIYYNVLKNDMNNILIEETTEEKLFPNSLINIFSMLQYMTILPIENFPEYFCIWVSSFNKIDSRKLVVDIKKNNKQIYHDTIDVTDYFHFTKRLHFRKDDIFDIHLQMINEFNEIVSDKKMVMNNQEFSTLSENGNFKMHNYPKISVVTRIKNMSNQIELLHNSLLMQTYKNFEWVIFDNKSTDDIYSKIHEWRKNDLNIYYKRLPEFRDFWKNYPEVNGEIIVVCDADDFLTKDALEHIAKVFESNTELDMFIGQSKIFGHGNMKLLDNNMFDNTAYHPTCYRRSAIEKTLEKNNNIEWPLTDDHEIVGMIRAAGNKTHRSNEVLYYYRKFNEQSITWNSLNLNNSSSHPNWDKSAELLHNKLNELEKEQGYIDSKVDTINEPNRYRDITSDFKEQLEVINEKKNSLHIVTISENYNDVKDMITSANKSNNKVSILGLETNESMERNFRNIMEYIDKYCSDDSVILYTDKSSHIFGDLYEIIDKFNRFDGDIVFAAEKNIWPDSSLKNEFDTRATTISPFKYIHNAFIGRAKEIRLMLDTILEKSYIDNNLNQQHQLQLYALENNLLIDTECEIFMPLFLVDQYEYKIESARIRNSICKTFPSILIGNGSGKDLLNIIKEKMI